jgi:hypothetical protein
MSVVWFESFSSPLPKRENPVRLQQSRTKPVALRHRRRVKAGMLFLPVERFERHWTRRSSENLEDKMVVVKTRCSCGQIRSVSAGRPSSLRSAAWSNIVRHRRFSFLASFALAIFNLV